MLNNRETKQKVTKIQIYKRLNQNENIINLKKYDLYKKIIEKLNQIHFLVLKKTESHKKYRFTKEMSNQIVYK